MGLDTYQHKRNFQQTSEPKGHVARRTQYRFVVQEHHASHLHFDFRLEMGGVLKSWSLPKGPTLDPRVKRLAVLTEDHPVEYLKFEGRIPEGNYGAGDQLIWDTGTYVLHNGEDPLRQLQAGKLTFELRGEKLHGEFKLIEIRERQWLLIKSNDEAADRNWKLELRLPTEKTNAASQSARNRKETRRSEAPVKPKAAQISSAAPTSTASRVFRDKKLSGDLTVKVGKETVSLTNLDKVYWPDNNLTKGDLLRYYYDISHTILPYLKQRPLILKRYPNGIHKPSFHQHDVDEAPTYARTVRLEMEVGHQVDYLVCDNLATLLYITNLGAIERHTWHSRLPTLEQPDWCVFDLDPGENVEFAALCTVAQYVREAITAVGLACFAKTSGARGIHIYVPLKAVHSYEQVAAFAAQIAEEVANDHADLVTVERGLKKRPRGSIYLDHLQNARGKSIVAPYSVRPKSGATVSAPLDWAEVKKAKLTPQLFTITNLRSRLEKKGELFASVLKLKQTLPRK